MVRATTHRCVACLVLTTALARTVFAGTFSVDPVRVSLAAGHVTDTVTIRNGSQEPVVVQLELASWSQHEGEPLLSPTTELLATPPIFKIPAGGSQLVRVGLRRAPDQRRELSYRLFLREVPADDPESTGVRIRLAISLPVFVTPLARPSPQVKWRVQAAPDGQLHVEATNQGYAHLHLAGLELSQAQKGYKLASQPVSGYLLGEDERAWLLKPDSLPSPGTLLHIRAITDSGELHAEVPLEAAAPESTGSAGDAPRG